MIHLGTVDELARQYVASRKSSLLPISTQKAIRAVRTLWPGCPHTDKEIAEAIASAAVDAGMAVEFDQTSIIPGNVYSH